LRICLFGDWVICCTLTPLNNLNILNPSTFSTTMNDLLKNPVFVFLAGLLALYLLFSVLKVVINLAWVFVLAFVVLFVVNARFRGIVRNFFNGLFKRDR
jgi:hypothetical protein